MVVFPNAKINLGLKILRRREDGYHNLETIFIPIGFSDILEIIPAGKKDRFTMSGHIPPGDPQENLVVKALRLVRTTYSVPPVRIHLHKNIPPGTGLGGGSSDAAFTLILLDRLFNLQCPDSTLHSMAAELGADCSFFMYNRMAAVSGKGEIITPLQEAHGSFHLILWIPSFSISTARAFQTIGNAPSPESPFSIFKEASPENWKRSMVNQFERSTGQAFDHCKALINMLYDNGAMYASLSGSGSSVFGLFRQVPGLCPPPENVFAWEGKVTL